MDQSITYECLVCGKVAKDRTEFCEHLLKIEDEVKNDFPVDYNNRIN